MRLPAGRWSLDGRPGLHSIRYRLALLFFTITFAAIAVVYVYVAPTLGSSLRTQRLDSLAIAAKAYSRPLKDAASLWIHIEHSPDAKRLESELARLRSHRRRRSAREAALIAGDKQALRSDRAGAARDRSEIAARIRNAAAQSSDRVTLLGIDIGPDKRLTDFYIADSSSALLGTREVGDLHFKVALRAAREAKSLTATETPTTGPVGEAARPLHSGGRVIAVAVFSGTLSDVEDSVQDIRGHILIAGAIALVLSLVAGYLVARALSLRVGRLEQAARRVAAGDFTARFSVDSRDELGQLAGALDSMQRQLAELDSARERFIATASHELRTPIFSLGGFLELIEDEDLDTQTRAQFVSQLRTQVRRLGNLATGLLDLSRLEAGALELHPEPTDLGEVAQMVSAEFIPALSQHSSRLSSHLPEDPVVVVCDPERVAQILRILIDNAIRHTPAGTDTIVTLTRAASEILIAVTDFGPGVPVETQGRIFEPFYTSGGVRGSGLGLAIAHELAERMGGSLTVQSAPGRTVFTLTLSA